MRIISGDEDEESGLAALECLRAVLVVLTAIRDDGDLYVAAEPIILPTLKENLHSGNLEYFEDFTRIVSCFAIYADTITEAVWEFIPLFYKQFDAWAFDFLPSK